MTVVGVDFGATSIRAGLVDRGKVVARARTETRPDRGVDGLIEDTAVLVEELAHRTGPAGVGVGFCGMVDAEEGRIIESTDTLPGWRDVPLAEQLSARLGMRVDVDNDANCAALGEGFFGAGRGLRSFAVFTLGTGIGGAILLHGELLRGAGFMAGKLGHIKVRAGGRRCACGAQGCVEAYASAYGLRRAYGADADTVFKDARAKNPRAERLVKEAAEALGTAFADVANVINPDRIAVGGGIAKAWKQLAPVALATFEKKALPAAARSTEVVLAELGDDAGILGASVLASQPD